MSEPLTLTIPVPPSLNNAYATVKGRRILSREGRAFKREVHRVLMNLINERAFYRGLETTIGKGKRVSLTLLLHFRDNRRRDISNVVKLAEDSLAEVLGFDDCAVDVLHVERKENDKANPRCEVTLKLL